jgi:hypothetical protein
MEGLERSFELSRAGTAVKHLGSCIWTSYSCFKLGLPPPALCTWSGAASIVFDSSIPLQPLTVLYSKPSELLDSCPKQVEAKRNNASGARQLSLPVDASTWCWPPKDGQPEWTLAT